MFGRAGRRAVRQEVGTMDMSKFKPSDWMMIGAGAVMLVLGMALDWAEYAGVSGNGPFDYFFTGGIAWILVVAGGVVALLLALGTMKSDGLPWPLVLVLTSGLSALLMLLRLILGGGDEGGAGFEIELDRGTGMYVAFVAAIVSAAGAVMGFRSAGGDLNDLKDINKLKAAFDKSGSETPPPPPPA
jgi:hypothetical protein